MKKVTFELVVRVEGDSLDEVDNGLVEAAGQRLAARIQQRAGQGIIPGGLVLKGQTKVEPVAVQPMVTPSPAAQAAIQAIEAANTTPEKKKPGRPKGWTKAAANEKAAEEILNNRSEETKETEEAPATETVPAAKSTYEDVVRAANSVFKAKGMDAAREILGKFGAQKIKDLTEDKYSGFVAECSKGG